jgi:5-methylcytosine-specific restriction endonuclease McrA
MSDSPNTSIRVISQSGADIREGMRLASGESVSESKVAVVPEPGPSGRYRANLPAEEVDAALRRALTELQRAERNAVLWFAEIAKRRLFRNLGYSSIHQYATAALGFSANRTYRFLRLAADLERLPRLRAAVVAGEIGWTKAREVVKVASAKTEERWIGAAKASSRRELEEKIARERRHRAAKRRTDPAQAALGASSPLASAVTGTMAQATRAQAARAQAAARAFSKNTASPESDVDLVDDSPTSVVFRLEPLQLARYEALIEGIRKRRVVTPGTTREEILLVALDQLLATSRTPVRMPVHVPVHVPVRMPVHVPVPEGRSRGTRASRGSGKNGAVGATHATINQEAKDRMPGCGVSESDSSIRREGITEIGEEHSTERLGETHRNVLPRGNSTTSYKIVVYRCEACQTGVVQTQRGPRRIAPAQMAAISCDTIIERSGDQTGAVRSQSTIRPSVRRAVLSRDRHKCRAAGCGNTRFLEIHHIAPRERGGSNRPDNLITLCSRCHRQWHERGLDDRLLAAVRCLE